MQANWICSSDATRQAVMNQGDQSDHADTVRLGRHAASMRYLALQAACLGRSSAVDIQLGLIPSWRSAGAG